MTLQVSIVFPCLNEEAAIGRCVDQALEVLARSGLRGEVLVVDNASDDRTADIATSGLELLVAAFLVHIIRLKTATEAGA